jgi:hypothetical protein
MSNERIAIELSNAEALVLFELLSRFKDHEQLSIEDQAEERVLWDVLCLLERELTEPFLPNYEHILKAARDRVRDKS